MPSAAGRWRWAWPVALAVAAAVPVLVAAVAALRHPWLPTGDSALLALRTDELTRNPPLTGAYSRYGFDHPGPLFLYLQYPFRLVAGPVGPIVAAAAISAASAVGIALVAWRRGGRLFGVVAVLVVLRFEASMGAALIDPWNPWVPVLPLLAAVLLAWSVLCRDWPVLPWLVVVASLAAQAHVAYTPLAGVALVLGVGATVVALVRERGAPGRVRLVRSAVVAGGLLVLVWLPPLVDQVRSPDPNASRIVEHFFGAQPESDPGGWVSHRRPDAGQVTGTLAAELGLPAPWMGGIEDVNPFVDEIVPASWLRLVPTLGVFAAGAVLARRRRDRALQVLAALVGGLLVLGGLSLARLTGGVSPYLVRWLWVLSALAWLVGLWSVSVWARTRFLPEHLVPLGRRVAVAGVAAAVLAASVALARTDPPDATAGTEVAAILDAVLAVVPADGAMQIDVAGFEAVGVRAGLVAELNRRGVDVVVPALEAERFGVAHAAGVEGGPVRERVVVTVGAATHEPGQAGVSELASYDPLTPDERRAFEALALRAVAELDAVAHGRVPADPLSDDDRARLEAWTAQPLPVRVWAGPVGR